MRLERRLKTKTSIDMTPLIDVIMQLIIFFMITTTFKTVPGIELALPNSSTARPVPQEELKVLVVSADEIHVGKELTDLKGLEGTIARALSDRALDTGSAAASEGLSVSAQPQAPKALLEGAEGIDYQLVVSVLDALRKNGVQAVGLATRTAEGESRPSP